MEVIFSRKSPRFKKYIFLHRIFGLLSVVQSEVFGTEHIISDTGSVSIYTIMFCSEFHTMHNVQVSSNSKCKIESL
jgi:uncharacterized membrane protein YbaN (DUF454 family)